jgi:hypothetical protein
MEGLSMSKRIIFCSDGTWSDAATNTNVYKIFKAMNFTAEQCPIYDDGVGSDGNTLLRLLGEGDGKFANKIRSGFDFPARVRGSSSAH